MPEQNVWELNLPTVPTFTANIYIYIGSPRLLFALTQKSQLGKVGWLFGKFEKDQKRRS